MSIWLTSLGIPSNLTRLHLFVIACLSQVDTTSSTPQWVFTDSVCHSRCIHSVTLHLSSQPMKPGTFTRPLSWHSNTRLTRVVVDYLSGWSTKSSPPKSAVTPANNGKSTHTHTQIQHKWTRSITKWWSFYDTAALLSNQCWDCCMFWHRWEFASKEWTNHTTTTNMQWVKALRIVRKSAKLASSLAILITHSPPSIVAFNACVVGWWECPPLTLE